MFPAVGFPYARKVVPKPLRAIPGRTEFKRPLHGATPGERSRQHAEAMVEWETAIAADMLPAKNPFAGMAPKPAKRGPASRQGFNDEQAVAVLTAARLEQGWLRWMPWLLAFTGLRIEEAAEARKQDVRQEAGVTIIDVVPTAQRALKTAQSQRMVPLHPALIAEGFVDYAQSLRPGPLFPDLKPGRYGSRGSTATKTHSRWVRGAVGLKDATLAPAHSWRHRMEDQLRIARVPAEAQDAITGHENPRNAGAG
jgi:integrase